MCAAGTYPTIPVDRTRRHLLHQVPPSRPAVINRCYVLWTLVTARRIPTVKTSEIDTRPPRLGSESALVYMVRRQPLTTRSPGSFFAEKPLPGLATGAAGATHCMRKTAPSHHHPLKFGSAWQALIKGDYSRFDPVTFSCAWIVFSSTCSIFSQTTGS